MDINIHAYGEIGGLWITETIRNLWILSAVLIVFAIIVRIKLKKFSDKPKMFQNIIEMLVETFHNLVTDVMGEEYSYFERWFFGVFVIILCCNLMGLIGLRNPTADLALTVCFGISTFVLIHFMGIVKGKSKYFKDYCEPFFFMAPLNIVGELVKPISLSFRLFGAVLSGFIIMQMVYTLLPFILTLVWPAALHGFFDVFEGSLQAYIFIMLSMTFIRIMIPEETQTN